MWPEKVVKALSYSDHSVYIHLLRKPRTQMASSDDTV